MLSLEESDAALAAEEANAEDNLDLFLPRKKETNIIKIILRGNYRL